MNTQSNVPARGTRVRTVLVASLCAMAALLSPLVGPASAAAPAGIVAWGDDSLGQVSATPAGTDFIAVSAGGQHNVALRADGSLVSWGFDYNGQVSGTPAGTGFTAVAAGGIHNVALRADGSLVSWGYDSFGQVSATPAGTGFTAVAAGGYHSLALRADGSLVSWGYNYDGQVSATPAGTGFTTVAAGVVHSLALRADGSLVSWGYDGLGQVSGAPAGTGFTAVAGGGHSSMALRADGSLVGWGDDSEGQVSGVPAGTGFTAVSAGIYHGLALRPPVDILAPVVTVPAPITVDAISPAGVPVSFTASATDDDPRIPAPPVTCAPASGATFPSGDTMVTCTATDLSGNAGQASFNVHVRGAAEQLADLIAASQGVGPGKSLSAKVERALADFTAGRIDKACKALDDYLHQLEVDGGKHVPAALAAELTAHAERIQRVMGC